MQSLYSSLSQQLVLWSYQQSGVSNKALVLNQRQALKDRGLDVACHYTFQNLSTGYVDQRQALKDRESEVACPLCTTQSQQ